jgi:hypothetical protein
MHCLAELLLLSVPRNTVVLMVLGVVFQSDCLFGRGHGQNL